MGSEPNRIRFHHRNVPRYIPRTSFESRVPHVRRGFTPGGPSGERWPLIHQNIEFYCRPYCFSWKRIEILSFTADLIGCIGPKNQNYQYYCRPYCLYCFFWERELFNILNSWILDFLKSNMEFKKSRNQDGIQDGNQKSNKVCSKTQYFDPFWKSRWKSSWKALETNMCNKVCSNIDNFDSLNQYEQ